MEGPEKQGRSFAMCSFGPEKSRASFASNPSLADVEAIKPMATRQRKRRDRVECI